MNNKDQSECENLQVFDETVKSRKNENAEILRGFTRGCVHVKALHLSFPFSPPASKSHPYPSELNPQAQLQQH